VIRPNRIGVHPRHLPVSWAEVVKPKQAIVPHHPEANVTVSPTACHDNTSYTANPGPADPTRERSRDDQIDIDALDRTFFKRNRI
jgi:hypothetical protein